MALAFSHAYAFGQSTIDPSQPANNVSNSSLLLRRQFQAAYNDINALHTPTWFDTTFCNTAGYIIARLAGSWTCAKAIPVNLTWLGADPTGAVDAATLINTTAASLGASGGTMVLDPGVYKIGSTISIGNGTSSSGSTINNVRLEGKIGAKANPATFPGFATQTGGTTLLWSGGSAPMVSINGPMQGWGLSKLYLDCNGTATIGLQVISAQFGSSREVNISGCQTSGHKSTTVAPFGSFTNTNSFRNVYDNFFVSVPNVAGAKGIWETSGGGAITHNTCYDIWLNLTTNQIGGAASYGVYLDGTDSDFFYFYKPIIAGGSNVTIGFDYTTTAFWPAANMFFGTEPGNPTNIGTPNGLSRPNGFYGVMEANGNVYPTNVQNTLSAVPAVIGGAIDLSGQTAAIALTNSTITPYKTGMYRINYYMGITTVGTGGTGSVQFQWNDGAATQNFVSSTTSLTALGYIAGSVDAYLIGGTNLAYQTNLTGATGTPAYQLRVRLERLD